MGLRLKGWRQEGRRLRSRRPPPPGFKRVEGASTATSTSTGTKSSAFRLSHSYNASAKIL